MFISDNTEGSFVQCSEVSPVTFCNGLDGVVEFGGGAPDNTNCDSTGLTDPGDGTCAA